MTFDAHAVKSKQPPLVLDGMETHPLNQKKQDRHRLRSLVIDDDNIILRYVARMLVRLGCQVETARDEPDVVNKLSTGTYDLLVTDLEMPEMNGYHLARSAKKKMHDTKVIIMTGRHRGDCLEMMATRWADGWLFKPFGLKELRAMLQGVGLFKDYHRVSQCA